MSDINASRSVDPNRTQLNEMTIFEFSVLSRYPIERFDFRNISRIHFAIDP